MIKLLNTNSFLNKIAVQEASLGKFICPKCSTFFTNSKTEYEAHLRENHIDYDQVSCIYCAVSFDFSKISSHIESHFEENLMSTNICNLCNTAVKMDSQESILDHLLFQHNNSIICPLCQLEYKEINQLLDHINENLKIVYHCTFEGCQMKTNDNEELNFHKNVSGHISDSCFEEHTFNCLSIDDENRFSFVENENILPKLEKENSFISINNDNNIDCSNELIQNRNISRINFVWQLHCRKDLFNSLYKNNDLEELLNFQTKLFSIDLYSIGIVLESEKKLYCCLECDYSPQYSHWDVKKHILVSHCSMTEKESRTSLRFIEFNKQSSKNLLNRRSKPRVSDVNNYPVTRSETSGGFVMKLKLPSVKRKKSLLNQTPCLKSKFNSILKIRYRKDLFGQFFRDSNSSAAIGFKRKISSVEQYSIGVMIANSKKAFYCLSCNYISYYSHGDVRKHILNFHCLISNKDARRCMRLVQVVDLQNGLVDNEDMKDLDLVDDENEEEGGGESEEEEEEVEEEKEVEVKEKKEAEQIEQEVESNNNNNNIKIKSKLVYMLKLFVRMDLFEEMFKNASSEISETLKHKMIPVNEYSIGVGVNKTKKTFYCQLCDYVSNYSNWDVRKHILVWHCGINNTDSYKCTKLVEFKQEPIESRNDNEEEKELEKDEEKEEQEQVVEKQEPKESLLKKKPQKTQSIPKEKSVIDCFTKSEMVTPFITGTGKLVRMHYLKSELKKVFPIASEEFLREIENKMENYKEYSLEVVHIKGVKYYVCVVCGYKSHYNQGDIKKHIMSKHCGISGNIVRDCIKLCKKDTALSQSFDEVKLEESDSIELPGRKKNRSRSLILKISRENCLAANKTEKKKQMSKKRKSCNSSYFISQPIETTAAIAVNSDTEINDIEQQQLSKPEKRPKLSLLLSSSSSMLSLTNLEESPKIIIEREIGLRYSESILRRLCTLENCLDQFSSIREKLKSYCQTKIRVARKFNSDIFICSHCNWFNWKSMSMVSKHILEMHTGIEQSFIGLVEASSKLNSEGQLLSDSELSKLGWNGKPILS